MRISSSPEIELRVMSAASYHYRSVAQQARFVMLRRQLETATDNRDGVIAELDALIRAERAVVLALHHAQVRDSRIGYEASNHYFYIPIDLAEKVLNCDALLAEWIPSLRNGGNGSEI